MNTFRKLFKRRNSAREEKSTVEEDDQSKKTSWNQRSFPGAFTEDVPSDGSVLMMHNIQLVPQRILGKGSYALVKLGYLQPARTFVAVKIVNRTIAPADFVEKFFPRELEIIPKLSHPNIVKCYDIIDMKRKVYIVMEYARNSDLLAYIKKYKIVAVPEAKRLFLKLVSAVSYLHQEGVVHRDLKCENVLLDQDHDGRLTVKLSDFGFARHFSNVDSLSGTYCGSAAYAACEILCGNPYDPRGADVWSLGVVLYVMLMGRMPFDENDNGSLIRSMRAGINFSNPRQTLDESARQLLRGMMEVDFNKRLNIKQLQEQPWLQDQVANLIEGYSRMNLGAGPSSFTPDNHKVRLPVFSLLDRIDSEEVLKQEGREPSTKSIS